MKKTFILLAVLSSIVNSIAQNSDNWQQVQSLGTTSAARAKAVGFSIGSKGYIGTGENDSLLKDFWEYDPGTNAWAQKADFGGTARASAIGFSNGLKGYIGLGYEENFIDKKDLWEYDPGTNAWIQKADFGGTARTGSFVFCIGNKAYIGLGYDANNHFRKDFWEYDIVTDTWSKKADFLGVGRFGATAFSINSKGYIGGAASNEFWEYDPIADKWYKKADYNGAPSFHDVGFSIGMKGYMGTGSGFYGGYKDFWEYDPFVDTWIQRADFGGDARSEAVGFSIGNFGYIGLGTPVNFVYYNDFWRYTPSGVLPLQFTTFTAVLEKSNAIINWQTANEINVAYFNIQRSFNGIDFSTIGKQNATNNSLAQKYNYTDNNITALHQQKIFYRLQSVDKNGESNYSKIAELNISVNSGIIFIIYPNPATNKLQLNITCSKKETLSIRIADMYGREVYIEKISAAEGSFNHDINISKLAKGVYTIQLISDEGVSKAKFVKE